MASKLAYLGYWVADEPFRWPVNDPQAINQLNFVKNWISKVKTRDPSKLTYFIFTPIGPLEAASDYAAALNTWFDDPDPNKRADVVSFDHYPFTDPEDCYWPKYSRKYFLNLSLATKEAAGRPVWVAVMTQAWGYNQYENSAGQCNPGCTFNCTCTSTCPPSMPDPPTCECYYFRRTAPQPTPETLRYQIYMSLAYGVKGLLYWNYLHKPGDLPAPGIDNPRLIEWNCNFPPTHTALYDVVKTHNRFIAQKLGPIIMNSGLVGTYHRSIFPPESEIPSEEMLSSSTPVLEDLEPSFVAGFFRGSSDSQHPVHPGGQQAHDPHLTGRSPCATETSQPQAQG